MRCTFRYMNEQPKAVMNGMTPDKNDDIAAVCGSGDQAFMLLEYANSVMACDVEPGQIEFAQELARLLENGRFDKFLHRPNKYLKIQSVIDYFDKPGRLEKIRSKLNMLDFLVVDDFTDILDKRQFNKAYLSNIITYWDKKLSNTPAQNMKPSDYINLIAERLDDPCLIYIAEQLFMREETDEFAQNVRFHKDDRRTEAANENEVWYSPIILTKTA